MSHTHVATDLEGIGKWAEQHSAPLNEAYQLSFHHVYAFIEHQAMLNVSTLTFFVTSPGMKSTPQGEVVFSEFAAFLSSPATKELFNHHKIRVTVLGKWHDLPQPVVEAARRVSEETRGNTNFFVNFCLSYDGQEEIVECCKQVSRLVKAGKLDVDTLTKEILKEQIATSFLSPPDIIIRNGTRPVLSSLLLWDSPGAHIVFSGKLFPELSVPDFLELLK